MRIWEILFFVLLFIGCTDTPTETPAPPSNMYVIFSDSFDSNMQDWPTGTSDGELGTHERSLSNGKYLWEALAKQGLAMKAFPKVADPVTDFYLTVDALLDSGPTDSEYGVVFRLDDNNNYYSFQANDDQKFSFWLRYNGKWIKLLDWKKTSAIRPGEVNRIGVLAEGSRFSFFINDQFVGEAEDDRLAVGRVGFYVLTRPDEVQNVFEFDNFKLSTATPNQLIFLAAEELPIAYVDKPYTYSFCKPDLSVTSDLCGAFENTTDPIGGEGHYTFQLDTMGGFPPFDITLNLNGMLTGKPTAAGKREFTVCAIDQTKAQVCRKKSLVVEEQAFTLTVKKLGNGGGKVTSSPDGISCGSICTENFKKDTEVTLTATPYSSSTFTGWSDWCSGTGTCEVTMDSDKTVNAIFDWAPSPTEAPTTTTAPSTTTPPPSEDSSVTIDSATCTVREWVYGNPASFTVASSGSASGPEGTSLLLPSFQDLGWDCGAWGNNCQRDTGEPESTNWNSQGNGYFGMQTTIQVKACTAGCVSATAPVTCPTS